MKEIKTLTATTQEYFLGQGVVRAVWILSAMKARRAAGCSASTFIQPLALEGVASWLVSGLKERSSGLHQLSPKKKNKGRHYASRHIYSLTHAFIHTLYSVKLLRLKPRRGRERERVWSRASSGGVLSLISLTLNKKLCRCERLRVWGRVNIKMWVVTSARDYSARPLEQVCGVRVVCKLTMPATSFILYGYL